MGLNHFDNKGNAVMVDVSDKDITERIATAEGKIKWITQQWRLLLMEHLKKAMY